MENEKIIENISQSDWKFIFKEINKEYKILIQEKFSDNKELLEVLEPSKINEAHFIKNDPGDINESLKDIYIILTKMLREILEKKYNVPEEITKHMHITNIKIPLVDSRSFNSDCCNMRCCDSIYTKCC